MASICEPLPDIVPFKIDEENQIYYFDADVAPTWDLSWEITIYAQKHVPGMKSLSHHKIEAEHMFLAPYSKETLKKFKKPTYVLYKSRKKLPPDEQNDAIKWTHDFVQTKRALKANGDYHIRKHFEDRVVIGRTNNKVTIFPYQWKNHCFTHDELRALLNNEIITITTDAGDVRLKIVTDNESIPWLAPEYLWPNESEYENGEVMWGISPCTIKRECPNHTN